MEADYTPAQVHKMERMLIQSHLCHELWIEFRQIAIQSQDISDCITERKQLETCVHRMKRLRHDTEAREVNALAIWKAAKTDYRYLWYEIVD